jgi:hypothetical protein
MKLWEECLKDIRSAIECSYPQKLMHKLYLRKAQCLMKLGNYQDATVAFNSGKLAVDDADFNIIRKAALIQDYDNHLKKCYVETPDELTDSTDPFKGISCDRLQPELNEDGHNVAFPSLAECCDGHIHLTRGGIW